MKKGLMLFAFMLLSAAFSFVSAQQGNTPPLSPKITAESPSKNVKVVYGQPSKRGRVIFGANGLEKYGKVWRTGANNATEITFAKDVVFGDKPVKAGTYTLFTIPEEKEWTVILNGELGQWGAYDYDKHKSKNVAEVKVPAKKTTEVMEKLTITPTDNLLTVAWDNASIAVPIKAGTAN